MKRFIWWIRRDLRLADNPALSAALAHSGRDRSMAVIPVFVLDPRLLASAYTGEKRLAFLYAGLHQLDADLRARGSRLLIRRGEPLDALSRLLAEAEADAVFAQEDISPFATQRDRRVAARLPLHLTSGLTVHPPGAVLKGDGDPYTVFTPYSKRWKSFPLPEERDLIPPPERLTTPDSLDSEPLPEMPRLPEDTPFPAGEAEALRRLEAFTQGETAPITRYKEDRNRPDLEGTSRLSPYLRLGMLSPRQAVVAAISARRAASSSDATQGCETWLNELIWREFYVSILYHFPHVRARSFRPELENIPWENDESAFAAWCQGQTGYPIVDAAMRQLAQTGWMHNRARMVVASFLVKDLLIDWRWGERWFMQHLVDGDAAANNGGWQWTAGTGTDAAPYFRIFNPVSQGQRFDPEGTYVKRWVPELAQVPAKAAHEPWTLSPADQRRAGCQIGSDYPAPIVDHKWARERTLAAYSQARDPDR